MPDPPSYRGRLIVPVCGGESARNVLLISVERVDPRTNNGSDLKFTEKQFYTADPAWKTHTGMYAVRFEPVEAPPFYQSIGDDVAFLYKGDKAQLPPELGITVNLPQYPDGLFRTSYSVDSTGLVVVVIAPSETTFRECSPRPIVAKVSKRGNIAVAWAFYAPDERNARAYVQWGFVGFKGDPASAINDILRDSAIVASTNINLQARQTMVDPAELEGVRL